MPHAPYHSLAKIQEAVANGRYRISTTAADDAGMLGFDQEDILECVKSLHVGGNFYKTLVDKYSNNQDVYKSEYDGKPIYLKVRLDHAGYAAIISFKRDESPDTR